MIVSAFLGGGCSTCLLVLGPKVAETTGDAGLDRPIREVRAYTEWSRTYGHGLEVDVWVARDPSDYSRDLRLEMDGAAKIFASLAGSAGLV